jgi:AAA domain, putative AbiEii toxin, Type IV TA system
MPSNLTSIHVKRFKGISNAFFDVASINVFIGANNSGKSSLAQLLHFGIAILQAIELAGRWSNNSMIALSLSPTQLLYSPCVDLYALGTGGKLLENAASAIELTLTLSNGEQIVIEIRRGRNGNIHVKVDNVPIAKTLSNLKSPFTIYSPGLAGIARHETYISDGVLLRTIARGDANLVLRNILIRLSEKPEAWAEFIADLRQLFEQIEISVAFAPETDEHIMVFANLGTGEVPIELAGTGVLQAVQILGYVHFFHPSVIVLDEPDSHLHPNNQRLLCKLLQGVADERSTQVFLTTHSRHVVDVLRGQAAFLWVRNGTVESIKQDHDLAVLVDIGALDVQEMLSQSQARCIVLTEDALKRNLEVLLEASDFATVDTLVLAYYGCTSPHNLRPLLELIRRSNPSAKIIVHRDRDYLTDDEGNEWSTKMREMGAEPFLTDGVDVESHYLNAQHIAELNNLPLEETETLINDVTDSCMNISLEKYVNGRSDLEKKNGTFGKLNLGQLAVNAQSLIDKNKERYRHSKTVLKALRSKFQEIHSTNIKVIGITKHLRSDYLANVASKIPAKA